MSQVSLLTYIINFQLQLTGNAFFFYIIVSYCKSKPMSVRSKNNSKIPWSSEPWKLKSEAK